MSLSHLYDLHCLLPLPGLYGRLQCLDCLPRLDVVVDGCVHLLGLGQVVAPLLFKADHLVGEGAPRGKKMGSKLSSWNWEIGVD